jgi:hypothetical protein
MAEGTDLHKTSNSIKHAVFLNSGGGLLHEVILIDTLFSNTHILMRFEVLTALNDDVDVVLGFGALFFFVSPCQPFEETDMELHRKKK